jgi:hypothetical protein
MVLLEKIGMAIVSLGGLVAVFYIRYRSAVDFEERRNRKSGLQGLFKKID